MIEKIQIENLKCTCVQNPASTRVVYMIYPEVAGFSDEWLRLQAARHNCSLVIVYVASDDWDNYLTPWPAPGVPKGSAPFKGLAGRFNDLLVTKVVPEAEKALHSPDISERDLLGVSLGGLFTLWQWLQSDAFRSIACLSGSFWYDGFMEWFDTLNIPMKKGSAFFLLGTEEPKAKVKAFQPVGTNTENIVDRLKSAGIPVKFEWVAGDHFADGILRAEKGLEALGTQRLKSNLSM